MLPGPTKAQLQAERRLKLIRDQQEKIAALAKDRQEPKQLQTVEEIRNACGDEAVVQHSRNLEPKEELGNTVGIVAYTQFDPEVVAFVDRMEKLLYKPGDVYFTDHNHADRANCRGVDLWKNDGRGGCIHLDQWSPELSATMTKYVDAYAGKVGYMLNWAKDHGHEYQPALTKEEIIDRFDWTFAHEYQNAVIRWMYAHELSVELMAEKEFQDLCTAMQDAVDMFSKMAVDTASERHTHMARALDATRKQTPSSKSIGHLTSINVPGVLKKLIELNPLTRWFTITWRSMNSSCADQIKEVGGLET